MSTWQTVAWTVARAGGLTAYVLLTLAVALGLALRRRDLARGHGPEWGGCGGVSGAPARAAGERWERGRDRGPGDAGRAGWIAALPGRATGAAERWRGCAPARRAARTGRAAPWPEATRGRSPRSGLVLQGTLQLTPNGRDGGLVHVTE